MKRKQKYYTQEFSSVAKQNFEKFFPLFNNKVINILQIGVSIGDASEWLIKNSNNLTKGSILYDVDPWDSIKKKYNGYNMSTVEKIYDSRIQSSGNLEVRKIKSDSYNFLINNSIKFDFIYIDGSHLSQDVLLDFFMSEVFLKNQGILAFDDYLYGRELPMSDRPKESIDFILKRSMNMKLYTILEHNYQLWIKKD
jgi:hypothetical protein